LKKKKELEGKDGDGIYVTFFLNISEGIKIEAN
jgi:hypothetical protein